MTPDPDVCPGRCNRAWEAAERRHDQTGEAHSLHPNPGQPIWCTDCRDDITSALQDIPRLADDVPASGRLLTPPVELGRLSRADIHASPSPAYDLHDELEHWITRHVTDTATRLGHSPKGHGIGYLVGRVTFILSRDPEGIEFGMQALTWRRRLTFASGGPKLVHHVPGQCPRCDMRGRLRRDDGDDLVKCRACGACWDVDHWRLLVRSVLAA